MKRALPLLVLLFSSTLWAVDVSGKWAGTLNDKSGHSLPWILNLQQEGNNLSGKMGPEKESDQRSIVDGTISGSKLHFRVPGGDGSGTEFVIVDLQWSNDELTGSLEGKDRKGQPQTLTVSLKRAKAQ
jgi:hypothetical protein